MSLYLKLTATKNVRYCSVSQFIHFTNTLKDQSLTTMFLVLCLAGDFKCSLVYSVVRNRVAYRYSGTDRNRDSFRKVSIFYCFVENRY